MNKSIPYPYSSLPNYEERYNLKESHDKFLEILLAFDAFCRKHSIKYSIADGTLLGALRHGDFVPWDDDADVMVTREEYDRIREAIKTDDSIHLVKLRFLDRIILPKYEKEGYYIDLFINDEMPKCNMLFEYKKNLTRILRCTFSNNGMQNKGRRAGYSKLYMCMRYIVGAFLKIVAKMYTGNRDVFELNDAKVRLNKNEIGKGIYTRFTSRMYETKRRFDKKSYDEGYIDIDFRGHFLMSIKNNERFLMEMYGDYNTLPPEEKRYPEHGFNMLLESPHWAMKKYY